MDYTEFTLQRLTHVLAEVDRLRNADFPHNDTKEALGLLHDLFKRDLGRIAKLQSSENAKLREDACAEAGFHIVRFLPILGFALRSTNVRNSFELFVPLLQVARGLLGGTTKLLLSSEWRFSPFTYPLVFPELPNFILIGLPASESGNALIVPLAGHELGHSVWRAWGVSEIITPLLKDHVLEQFRLNWSQFQSEWGQKVDVSKIETDLIIRPIWSFSLELARRQVEEIFCDSMGIRIFGACYFHSMEYLVSPHCGNSRSLAYPDIKTRTRAMIESAKAFGCAYQHNYCDRFTEKPASVDSKQKLLVGYADAATKRMLGDVISVVDAICKKVELPLPSDVFAEGSAAESIYNRFKMHLPAVRPPALADIINAGWRAYLDDNLWPPCGSALERFSVLNELILKTVEVMEYEIRMAN